MLCRKIVDVYFEGYKEYNNAVVKEMRRWMLLTTAEYRALSSYHYISLNILD